MKKTYLLSTVLLMFLSSSVIAEETLTEKLETKTNDVERATNKAINRAQEATCTDSDAECLKQKAKNRASEALIVALPVSSFSPFSQNQNG